MASVGSQHVAQLAGVSRSTVSRVFTPGTYVAEETKQKVLQAAEMLGYRPNIIARSLTTRSTRLVGIVTGHLENPSHAALVRLIASGVQDSGMASLLVTARYNEVGRVIQSLMSYQVDALVVTSAVPTAAISAECERAGIPLITTHPRQDTESLAVIGDNRAGAILLADHLVEQGWSRFSFIAGLKELPTSTERESAFVSQLARHGKSLMARRVGDFDRALAAAAMRELMAQRTPPDAVFCANDEMAVAAIDVARLEFGMVIGRDLAVVGYDDSPLASLRAYDLTSVNANIPEIAAAVVRMVTRKAAEASSAHPVCTIPPTLVIRGSSQRHRI